MGTKERRDREKQELRQAILTAAREIASAEGWSAVSIRKIADKIEYSPPMIYEYFEDKDALLVALLAEGFRELTERIHNTQTEHADPREALIALGGAYWDFAMENPELYQVMHGLAGGHINSTTKANKPPELRETVETVLSAFVRWGKANSITTLNYMDAFMIVYSTLHGLVALSMAQRFSVDRDSGRALMRSAVATLLDGWTR
ncbi:MAG: TetR/AcrR family transcriptional regulator [Anaerolineae bacterium]|nr:TetR/AcrR family transcriptional regulator [Anaerolineae bacterium]